MKPPSGNGKNFFLSESPGEEYTEITKRLSELEIPVKMEQGYMEYDKRALEGRSGDIGGV